ncbi:MAG: response regulator [Campylobacterota bacterium]|nr:response regulator [Campylobacterota bacterium]
MILKEFTVLYIEDDLDMQDYMTDLLHGEIKELYLASNGEEGLEMYKDKKPDIILSDIDMPYMDGLMMSHAIKKIDRYQSIIFLTALNDIEIVKEAIDIGVNSFINKPIENAEVLLNNLEYQAQRVQNDRDALKYKEFKEEQDKVKLVLKMIQNISHHWKQPLNHISVTASVFELEQELNILDQEKCVTMAKSIVDNTQELAHTLKKIEQLDYNTVTLETIEELISIRNPLYSKSA